MTLDANVIIAYLSGEAIVVEALARWRREEKLFFLSTVVEAEVLSFTEWTQEEQRATEVFLEENFTSIAFDRAIARIAAKIRRHSRVKFPDAAIAATALFTGRKETSPYTSPPFSGVRLEAVMPLLVSLLRNSLI